jgi:hypothetical protein
MVVLLGLELGYVFRVTVRVSASPAVAASGDTSVVKLPALRNTYVLSGVGVSPYPRHAKAPWQSRGREFDPPWLHQQDQERQQVGGSVETGPPLFLLGLEMGLSRARAMGMP